MKTFSLIVLGVLLSIFIVSSASATFSYYTKLYQISAPVEGVDVQTIMITGCWFSPCTEGSINIWVDGEYLGMVPAGEDNNIISGCVVTDEQITCGLGDGRNVIFGRVPLQE